MVFIRIKSYLPIDAGKTVILHCTPYILMYISYYELTGIDRVITVIMMIFVMRYLIVHTSETISGVYYHMGKNFRHFINKYTSFYCNSSSRKQLNTIIFFIFF